MTNNTQLSVHVNVYIVS